MKTNLKKLLILLAIPLAAGGFSALLSGGMNDYQNLVKPPLSPPGWLFPVAWTILYLLMGYASYRIAESSGSDDQKKKAFLLYGVQLFLNFLWSPVYFGLEWQLVAFFLLLALWFAVFWTIRAFTRIDELAADLLLPYLLWLTFAAYLNLGTVLLN